jgi:CMP-N,N'-diacetyllegionaminic acid synthase
MAFRGFSVLGIVPARGGSKGIPRKNLTTVGGISLIGHAARVLRDLDFVDRMICSTDDVEIAAEAKRHGLETPRMRPAELSGDAAQSVDVWRHEWIEQERLDGVTYDLSLLVQPTSPLRRANDLKRTITSLIDNNASAACTVSRTPDDFTPHKTLTIDDDGRVKFYLPDGQQFSRRQDIPPYYYRNGLCYAARRSAVVDNSTIVENDCVPVIIDRAVANIDEPEDLLYAEFLFARGAW